MAGLDYGSRIGIPGLHNPLSDTYAALKDEQFTRSRNKMFESQYPVLQQKREMQGTRALQFSITGRGPFDPYKDRIINGLVAGNPDQVAAAMSEWLEKVPRESVKKELQRIKDTIQSNSPLKVGGSTKPEAVFDFLTWAKTNLPEGEARRVFALASTYAKTAIETGLEEKSKEFQALANLDYDKFKTPPPANASVNRAVQIKKTAEGNRILADFYRREKAARALLTH
jgi:hypothetical protein